MPEGVWSEDGTVLHTCGGSAGCMCVYDPKLNTRLSGSSPSSIAFADGVTYGSARATDEVVLENVALRNALAELVRLKDGPRDDHYRASKDAAWQAARDALSVASPEEATR